MACDRSCQHATARQLLPDTNLPLYYYSQQILECPKASQYFVFSLIEPLGSQHKDALVMNVPNNVVMQVRDQFGQTKSIVS